MIQLTDFIWRGPRPQDLRILGAQGFRRAVSFQSGSEDRFTDSLVESQRTHAEDFNIDYRYVPCRSWTVPTERQVADALAIMQDAEHGRVKTYVHCHSGVDRTGFMCAMYRIRVQGWDWRKAADEWEADGRHWWFFRWRWLLWWRNRT